MEMKSFWLTEEDPSVYFTCVKRNIRRYTPDILLNWQKRLELCTAAKGNCFEGDKSN
jgi:hypothetical protein